MNTSTLGLAEGTDARVKLACDRPLRQMSFRVN
jgi:hypothetical protein